MHPLKLLPDQLDKSHSIKSLIDWGSKQLNNAGIDESRLHAELLLCEALKCTRADLRLGTENIVDEKSAALYEIMLNRRKTREPLQHILGKTEFMGFHFVVSKNVFIPRPETELLVEIARDICFSRKGEIYNILDIGTGSGNIAVSIAYLCTGIMIDAIDSDREALNIAHSNIEYHKLTDRIITLRCDIFTSCREITDKRYDMVVSNPPYIPVSEYLTLEPEVRDYEPRHACTDGADGLSFYKRIAGLCRVVLREGGYLLAEIGHDQSSLVTDIFSHEGFQNIKVWKDYAGHDRIVGGERSSI